MPQNVNVGAKRMSLSAVVIRADGTREDLGIISYYHRNPLKRLWYRLTKKGLA
jgi:hypothetical protein